MSTPEIYISDYYLKLNAYLQGVGNDPGNFHLPDLGSQSYPHIVTVNSAIPESYRWLYKRLDRIVEHQRSFIQNIIVQGSYGDFTNNNYSDLDIILYLEASVVENQRKRQLLRKVIQKNLMPLIYSIDPLQHHGVFLVWPQLCDCYVESILPLVVYSKAWSVHKFEVNFRCATKRMPPRTPGLIQTILKESRRLVGWINFYHLKRLTSHIMMVPCLFYMDQGIYFHKANSFAPFIQNFPKAERLLADVTEIRKRWPKKPWLVYLMGLHDIGYHMFGKRYPLICGLLYRSRWIRHYTHRLDLKALPQSVSLKKNAISQLS